MIHVWLADLEDATLSFDSGLSPDEMARAARFVFERDRRRFARGRARTRALLGGYLGIDAGQLRFEYESHGKPRLASGQGGSDLDFNVSHSETLLAVAISSAGPVGVDVEAVRCLDDRDALARRTFAPAEVRCLESLAAEDRDAGFFRAWTRKEAFVKALGEGLSHPLDRFEVSITPGQPAKILSIDGDCAAAAAWHLENAPLADGYLGAVAVRGTAVVRWYSWGDDPLNGQQHHATRETA